MAGAAVGMLAGALAALPVVGDSIGDSVGEVGGDEPATRPTPTSAPRTAGQPGHFRVECPLVRQAHVDPIVAPGRASHHLHDLFGNVSITADSTYASMLADRSDCSASGDTAAYWSPALVAPGGTVVQPERAIFYYRNRPTGPGGTTPFPRDFRMVAGGGHAFPNAYWTCEGDKDVAREARRHHLPECGAGGQVKLHVLFPSCWDGERLDSVDHRSHVAYGLGEAGTPDGTHPVACPASHPVALPQLDFRVVYPVPGGAGYRLADGEVLPHADFWNTWQQYQLEAWVQRCLWKGVACNLATGEA